MYIYIIIYIILYIYIYILYYIYIIYHISCILYGGTKLKDVLLWPKKKYRFNMR